MRIYCDNKVAISISHNLMHHNRTKHVEVDMHFITKKIKDEDIYMTYVKTTKQAAYIITKGLSKPLFKKLMDKLELFN